jgi:hypothetical protein
MKKVVMKKLVFVIFIVFLLINICGIFALSGIKVPVDNDKNAPELINFDYSIDHRKVTFSFIVDEDNFKQIFYRDVAECRRKIIKYDVLCRRLNPDGECFAVRDLCPGKHHMQITIVDRAGNIFTGKPFDFSIDY